MGVSPHISGFLRDTAPDIPHHRQNTLDPHDFKNPETGNGSDKKLAAKDTRAGDGKPQGRQR